MLFIDHPATGPESHAVAALARHDYPDRLVIWDPLVGARVFTCDLLAIVWGGHGISFTRSSQSHGFPDMSLCKSVQ